MPKKHKHKKKEHIDSKQEINGKVVLNTDLLIKEYLTCCSIVNFIDKNKFSMTEVTNFFNTLMEVQITKANGKKDTLNQKNSKQWKYCKSSSGHKQVKCLITAETFGTQPHNPKRNITDFDTLDNLKRHVCFFAQFVFVFDKNSKLNVKKSLISYKNSGDIKQKIQGFLNEEKSLENEYNKCSALYHRDYTL